MREVMLSHPKHQVSEAGRRFMQDSPRGRQNDATESTNAFKRMTASIMPLDRHSAAPWGILSGDVTQKSRLFRGQRRNLNQGVIPIPTSACSQPPALAKPTCVLSNHK